MELSDKIEIRVSVLDDNRIERAIYMNGKERFFDRRDIRTAFPDENDPIRRIQFFLGGKEFQSTCHGCRYAGNHINPPESRGVNIFGKFKQFIVQLFKVRT
jgi:hypothetical protein